MLTKHIPNFSNQLHKLTTKNVRWMLVVSFKPLTLQLILVPKHQQINGSHLTGIKFVQQEDKHSIHIAKSGKNNHYILSCTANLGIDPYTLGTWELNAMLLWGWKPHFNSWVMDFILNECERRLVNEPQQNIQWLMMLKINLNAGSSFHCLSMTWSVPADLLRDTAVTRWGRR